MEDNKANRFRFRAWDSNRNIMLLPDIKDDAGLDEWYDGEWSIFNGALKCVQEGGWTLMQSTGLVDKNGKEIFEGDLLEYDGEIIEIKPPEWQVIDAFCVHCRPGLDSFRDDYSRQDEPSRMIRNGEIIGNIYENGDLLE